MDQIRDRLPVGELLDEARRLHESGVAGPVGGLRGKPVPSQQICNRVLGEAEAVRRLAESSRLDLFRPFPDLEMVEVLARDNITGNFAGLQVKARTVTTRRGEARFDVRRATVSHSASTWLVGLAWRRETSAFDDEFLLIPAADIPKVGTESGPSFEIVFHPKSRERTRLDPYRRRLADLDRLILEACVAGGSLSERPA